MTYRYSAFGLIIESDIAMEELSPAAGEAPGNIRIVEEPIGRPLPPVGAPPQFDYHDPEGFVLIWPGVAGFRILGPDRIQIQPYPDTPTKFLAFPLLGPVMGWVLHLRGFYVLHASAVAVQGRSIAFVGDKMAGKSTTAAAFLRNGASLLTDDLLALRQDSGGFSIMPAFAQLKLTEDAAKEVVVPGAEALPLVLENFAKRQHRLSAMHDRPVGCDAIMVLDRGGDRPVIEWFDGEASFKALMRFSYNARFASAPAEMQDRARHFAQTAALAKQVRIGRLGVPADLARLDETVRMATEAVLSDDTADA